eukprot:TRINITY_DN3069_c0_g1_i13.p2 TRINITY_DN3069_c0_g1~~TRINITY_DN3069_c0_g1_i13.p2  ORF type:complete len:140 (-),score=7.45 TRINITY_DN3069_c0_g1_i13:49-468(-)
MCCMRGQNTSVLGHFQLHQGRSTDNHHHGNWLPAILLGMRVLHAGSEHFNRLTFPAPPRQVAGQGTPAQFTANSSAGHVLHAGSEHFNRLTLPAPPRQVGGQASSQLAALNSSGHSAQTGSEHISLLRFPSPPRQLSGH